MQSELENRNTSPRRLLNERESKLVGFIFSYFEKTVRGDVKEGDLNFLISVQEQYEKDGRLSDKQLNILEKIFSKY